MRADVPTPADFSTEPIWPGFPARALSFTDPLGRDAGLDDPVRPGAKLDALDPGVPELDAMHHVFAAVSGKLDAAQAVDTALREALASTGATAGSIWLFQRDGSIVRAAHSGLTPDYLRAFADAPDWPSVQRDIGRVADVSVHDDGDLPWLPEHHRRMTPMLGLRTFAVVPLRTRGLRIGSMVLGHPQPAWFRGHSLAFFRMLGELIAGALDDARLLAEVRAAGEPHGEGNAVGGHAPVDRMLAALDIGVALVSAPDGEVLEHNPAFSRLVSPGGGEAPLRATLRELLPEGQDSAILVAAGRALREGRPVALTDLEVHRPQREAAFWDVVLTPLAPAPFEPAGRLVVTVTDVTERRALEDRLRSAQKLEAVGTLAGGIAHEFNNLLTAILGQVSLALFDLPAEHPLVPGLRDCETAAIRAAELTRQLLGFGRRWPVRLEPTDLREVVAQALPLFEHAIDPGIVVEREDAPDLWSVPADPAQMGQALMNLCLNARDAMPEGGRLRISLRNEALPWPGSRRSGDFVVLEVSDTGSGMPPEVLGRVFEPFYTTKGPDRGTGLGLSVVHGIVEQHGGWVECDSTPGAGTRFRIHLPRINPAGAPLSAPPGRGEVVLVVDDEEALRNLARSVLERLGYQVLLASDGAEAVAVYREHRERITLVLLDLTMPRLSGRETLAEMRAISSGLRIVLMSGYGAGPAGGSLAAEADGFLPKPYSPDQIAAVVGSVLGSRR